MPEKQLKNKIAVFEKKLDKFMESFAAVKNEIERGAAPERRLCTNFRKRLVALHDQYEDICAFAAENMPGEACESGLPADEYLVLLQQALQRERESAVKIFLEELEKFARIRSEGEGYDSDLEPFRKKAASLADAIRDGKTPDSDELQPFCRFVRAIEARDISGDPDSQFELMEQIAPYFPLHVQWGLSGGYYFIDESLSVQDSAEPGTLEPQSAVPCDVLGAENGREEAVLKDDVGFEGGRRVPESEEAVRAVLRASSEIRPKSGDVKGFVASLMALMETYPCIETVLELLCNYGVMTKDMLRPASARQLTGPELENICGYLPELIRIGWVVRYGAEENGIEEDIYALSPYCYTFMQKNSVRYHDGLWSRELGCSGLPGNAEIDRGDAMRMLSINAMYVNAEAAGMTGRSEDETPLFLVRGLDMRGTVPYPVVGFSYSEKLHYARLYEEGRSDYAEVPEDNLVIPRELSSDDEVDPNLLAHYNGVFYIQHGELHKCGDFEKILADKWYMENVPDETVSASNEFLTSSPAINTFKYEAKRLYSVHPYIRSVLPLLGRFGCMTAEQIGTACLIWQDDPIPTVRIRDLVEELAEKGWVIKYEFVCGDQVVCYAPAPGCLECLAKDPVKRMKQGNLPFWCFFIKAYEHDWGTDETQRDLMKAMDWAGAYIKHLLVKLRLPEECFDEYVMSGAVRLEHGTYGIVYICSDDGDFECQEFSPSLVEHPEDICRKYLFVHGSLPDGDTVPADFWRNFLRVFYINDGELKFMTTDPGAVVGDPHLGREREVPLYCPGDIPDNGFIYENEDWDYWISPCNGNEKDIIKSTWFRKEVIALADKYPSVRFILPMFTKLGFISADGAYRLAQYHNGDADRKDSDALIAELVERDWLLKYDDDGLPMAGYSIAPACMEVMQRDGIKKIKSGGGPFWQAPICKKTYCDSASAHAGSVIDEIQDSEMFIDLMYKSRDMRGANPDASFEPADVSSSMYCRYGVVDIVCDGREEKCCIYTPGLVTVGISRAFDLFIPGSVPEGLTVEMMENFDRVFYIRDGRICPYDFGYDDREWAPRGAGEGR